MGRVFDDVREKHLDLFPSQEKILIPFLPLFDITRGDTESNLGSTVYYFLLKPEPHTTQMFGFDREILLVFVPYNKFEPRTVQIVDHLMSKFPVKGRVEPLCYILVSDDKNILENISIITSSSVEVKTIVPFERAELENNSSQWFSRNRIAQYVFSRDLFDISQPLAEDTYFFGRQTFSLDLVDRFKRGQNTGLFGLRKSGKTSMIAKIARTLDSGNLGKYVIIDAQNPNFYMKRWWDLLGEVTNQFSEQCNVTLPNAMNEFSDPGSAVKSFSICLDFLRRCGLENDQKFLLIIDEYEHICPGLSFSKEWEDDYFPFWQTIRAFQTKNSWLSCMIVGVNPTIIESSTIMGRDNPLFSLIPRTFIPSFTKPEVREMVRTLGKHIGMKFEESVYEYLKNRYGGHPMLTRLACSHIYKHFTSNSSERPFEVSLSIVKSMEKDRDLSLSAYAKHILDVLNSWYPMEYEMFEMLCQGYISDYEELASQEPQLREHLFGYGLVDAGRIEEPSNLMIGNFVQDQASKKLKKQKFNEPEPLPEKNHLWSNELDQLADSVVHSRTFCQELAIMLSVKPIMKDDKIRIGAKLADLRVSPISMNRNQFQESINTLQQLFWDCIENSERSVIKQNYPMFYEISDIIRSLRHWLHHPDLSDPHVRKTALEYILKQTSGFPSTPRDWAKIHLEIMRSLVDSLRDAQNRMYSLSTPAKGK
jgi:AAA-like domain